jgi:hypothetical protein
MSNYSNPALEAELAYRRDMLRASAQQSRNRRWLGRRTPSRPLVLPRAPLGQ